MAKNERESSNRGEAKSESFRRRRAKTLNQDPLTETVENSSGKR